MSSNFARLNRLDLLASWSESQDPTVDPPTNVKWEEGTPASIQDYLAHLDDTYRWDDSDKQQIAEAYHLGEIPFDLVLPDWDFNIAPTTFQPVIRSAKETGQRELVRIR
jgi:hypothetical protein